MNFDINENEFLNKKYEKYNNSLKLLSEKTGN